MRECFRGYKLRRQGGQIADVSLVFVLIIVCALTGVIHSTSPDCQRHHTGRHGKGIIKSYNFPFNYRDLSHCRDLIYTDHLIDEADVRICFEFRRFDLELGYDLVTFVIPTSNGTGQAVYSGRGGLFRNDSSITAPSSIWDEPFCWSIKPSRHKYVIIEFESDQLITGRGYYADFWLEPTSPQHRMEDGKAVNGRLQLATAAATEPCERRCFSDTMCISESQECDSHYDCSDKSDETYAHARCQSGKHGPSLDACDFDVSRSAVCGLDGASEGWIRSFGSSIDAYKRGPPADHTIGIQNQGAFLYTDFVNFPGRVRVSSASMTVSEQSDKCFSFWYFMYGRDPGSLHVHDNLRDDGKALWSRIGSFASRWIHAEIQLDSSTDWVMIEASNSSDMYSRIALDDISMTEGSCSGEDISNTFERNISPWQVSPAMTWTRECSGDHASSYGCFLVASRNDVTLTSPMLTAINATSDNRYVSDHCLVSWYMLNGDAYIQLELVHNDGTVTVVTGLDWPERRRRWSQKKVDLALTEPSQVRFRAVVRSKRDRIYLDDIAVIPGRCDELVLESCSVGQFRCQNGECVDMRLVCSGISECTDGSDESDMTCCPTGCPPPSSFCCRNGRCTMDAWVCDGHNDCGDWSDEDGCYNSSCPNDRHLCEDEGRCMVSSNRCNGYQDCADGSDEKNCGFTLSTGAILGIALAASIIFVMASVKITLMTKNRDSCPCNLCCCREDDTEGPEAGSSDDTPGFSSYQLPPPYSEVANNRAFIIHKETDPGSQDGQPPPSYDSVSKGDFQELRVPNSAEVRRLQDLMRHRAALPTDAEDDTHRDIGEVNVAFHVDHEGEETV